MFVNAKEAKKLSTNRKLICKSFKSKMAVKVDQGQSNDGSSSSTMQRVTRMTISET